MKTFALSLYSLTLFSIYFAFDVAKPVVLYMLTVNYVCLVCGWFPPSSDRLSLLTWSSVWISIAFFSLLRDVDAVTDISVLSGVWLLILLVSVIISSCYVIINDSRFWYEQMFAISALHWVVFHDAQSWLAPNTLLLAIPVLTMFVAKYVHHRESNLPVSAVESVVWFVLFVCEICYDIGATHYLPFYGVAALLFAIALFVNIAKQYILLIFTFPLVAPFLLLWCVRNICEHGVRAGIDKTFDSVHKKWTVLFSKKQPSVLKPSEVDDL